MIHKTSFDIVEAFFKRKDLYIPESIKLNDYTEITDPKKFIEANLAVVKFNINKDVHTFHPYLERLIVVKSIIEGLQ